MKKALLPSWVAIVLLACNSAAPPKDVAAEFIQAIKAGEAAKAAALATTETKALVSTAKATAGGTANENLVLTETINGNTAEVNNETVAVMLKKEGNDWKVDATPQLLATLTESPENLELLGNKWNVLQKEYTGRLNVAREYVQYKKGQGSLSVPMQNLERMVNKLSAETSQTNEMRSQYLQDQKELETLLDKAHEPTQTAHADLSMNYFLQLSQAADRIKAAQREYNEAAVKFPSVLYPALALQR